MIFPLNKTAQIKIVHLEEFALLHILMFSFFLKLFSFKIVDIKTYAMHGESPLDEKPTYPRSTEKAT